MDDDDFKEQVIRLLSSIEDELRSIRSATEMTQMDVSSIDSYTSHIRRAVDKLEERSE